jgi:hypothetical protein
MPDQSVTLCAMFQVPPEGIAAFQAYEAAVLPLLTGHGGVLRERLRTADGRTEIHVIRFLSAAGLEAYRGDARRADHAELFKASGAEVVIWQVTDVNGT